MTFADIETGISASAWIRFIYHSAADVIRRAASRPGLTRSRYTLGAVTKSDQTVELVILPGFEETPSLKRSNAFDLVAEECRAVRERAGMLDISGFSRYQVSGQDAQSWLDRIMAGRLPKPGRARLAPMVSPQGRLKGDLTLFNWGDGTWWIMGSYYLRQWHMRWFEQHIPVRI